MVSLLESHHPPTADTWRLALGAVAGLDGVRRMRHQISALLRETGLSPDLISDAELILTELVSNAIKYGRIARVVAYLRGHSLHVDVWDASLQEPRLVDQSGEREWGRGLDVVQSLATQWGFEFPEIGGKSVWFDLAIPQDDAAVQT